MQEEAAHPPPVVVPEVEDCRTRPFASGVRTECPRMTKANGSPTIPGVSLVRTFSNA